MTGAVTPRHCFAVAMTLQGCRSACFLQVYESSSRTSSAPASAFDAESYQDADDEENGSASARRAGGKNELWATEALAALKPNQQMDTGKVLPQQHHTRPPPRYTGEVNALHRGSKRGT